MIGARDLSCSTALCSGTTPVTAATAAEELLVLLRSSPTIGGSLLLLLPVAPSAAGDLTAGRLALLAGALVDEVAEPDLEVLHVLRPAQDGDGVGQLLSGAQLHLETKII